MRVSFVKNCNLDLQFFFREVDLSHTCQLNVRNLYEHYVESLFPITIEWHLTLPTSEEIRRGRGREQFSKSYCR